MKTADLSLNKKIIILENTILSDGIGDYSHLRDILVAAINNPELAAYHFIPVICTNDFQLCDKIEADLLSLKITEFYVSSYNFKSSSIIEQLKPIYARAEQVFIISSYANLFFEEFLNPHAVIKTIYEHEFASECNWSLVSGRPTLKGTLGLRPNAFGIKVADIQKKENLAFWEILGQYDSSFADKLLKTTNCTDFSQFNKENIFAHAYFTNFEYLNGFSLFLALMCKNVMSSNKNLVIHLSSHNISVIEEYVETSPDKKFTRLNFFLYLITLFPPADINIKQIDFFSPGSSHPISIPLNPNGCKTIRVYEEYLSQQSYEMVFDASEIVGVSGDNTFEQSVAHQVLPFYHSTNYGMKWPTWHAIEKMIETTDFGFSEEIKQDLLVYFSYEAVNSRQAYWKQLVEIDLNRIKEAWPVIANHIKSNRNFYNLFENLVLMSPPNIQELSDRKKLPVIIQDHNQKLSLESQYAKELKLVALLKTLYLEVSNNKSNSDRWNKRFDAATQLFQLAENQLTDDKVISQKDISFVKEQLAIIKENDPSWQERSLITKILDILSLGIIPIIRYMFFTPDKTENYVDEIKELNVLSS